MQAGGLGRKTMALAWVDEGPVRSFVLKDDKSF